MIYVCSTAAPMHTLLGTEYFTSLEIRREANPRGSTSLPPPADRQARGMVDGTKECLNRCGCIGMQCKGKQGV
jgi:hypothetical protein